MTKTTNIQQDTFNVPKGYKKTPLGIIPKEWEVKKLGDIGTISSGMTPLRSNLKFHNGSIPWVKTTDLNNAEIYETEEKVTEYALENTSLRIYPVDTVLVAMYGGFNQIGRTGILKINSTINQALSAINISDNNVSSEYLLSWLNSKVNYWRKFAGSSRKDPNITSRDVSEFPIAIPPLPEQQKIAEILSTWDIAIEKQNALIEQLELRKCGLMQQLLTGKSRLRKASGERFKGEWKKARLGKILDYEQPTPYLVKDSIYNDSFDIPVLTAGKTFILGYTNEKNGIYSKVPVIIFDDFTTDTKYVDFPFKAKSSAMKILKCKENTNIKFVYEAMQMIKYVVGGHERHWISKFAHISIPLPSLAEQTAIAEVLSTADREIEIEKQKLTALKNQKKELMQVLLSGKIRVKN